MNTAVQLALPPEALRWRCNPEELGFETTDDVAPLETMVGQTRGVNAIEFALSVESPGHNVYVAGPSGTGRTTTVRAEVRRAASSRAAAPDWCYLFNFRDPYQPIAVRLPSGRGSQLARDLEQLFARCRREIPLAFESELYERERSAILHQLQEQREAITAQFTELASRLGIALQFMPPRILSFPAGANGEPMPPEEFDRLPESERAAFRTRAQQLEGEVEKGLLAIRRIERSIYERVQELDRNTALAAIGPLTEELSEQYLDVPRLDPYLDSLREDLITHLDELHPSEGGAPQQPGKRPAEDRYSVNVLVSHEPNEHAPVIFEPHPNYYNLLGRIDYRASMGAMQTDFTLIKPGALHRANGGYLVLQARDLLLSPFAWDALKRALRDAEVRVENLGEQLTAFPTASLKPEPIPLSVKVILVGDLYTYQLLYQLDEDFHKLFKVKAQFGPTIDRSPETLRAYASFVSGQVRTHGLHPFDKGAVALIIESSVRLAEHQERLPTQFSSVSEMIIEADHWARQDNAAVVGRAHVERALAESERRLNLTEDLLQQAIEEGIIGIDTHSEAVGQINGLSVLDLGDYAFARPSRITARVGVGSDGVVNIERAVEMSGKSHSKGVLILGGYLLGKYGSDNPLSVSARLTFEQTYGEIDGDSASSTELYALLSALANLPIKQGIAVTGSVDQMGAIQAIGGVTRKVEGFFAVCKAQGLTGGQGVVIPRSNARHLMLSEEVADAVRRGDFHVWAVDQIDQGIEILTGVSAGEPGADGEYPPDSAHGLVQSRLITLAQRLKERGHQDSPRVAPPVGDGVA